MRILVLGDTHIPDRALILSPEIMEEAKKADLIIHNGDISDMSVIKDLEKIVGKGKVKAVFGNMDSMELVEKLPETLIFEAEGKKIVVYHGDGPPWGMEARMIRRLIAEYGEEKVKALDIIIFGHDHQPRKKKINSTLLFNPGSPTDVFFAPYRSYGIIEIEKGKIKAEIIKI